MKATVPSRLFKTKVSYKQNFDKNVHQEPAFKIRDYVFVYRSKLAAIASGAADKMANCRYYKILRRAPGPYRVLSVQLHLVTIEEDGIPNNVSIDRPTLLPTREQVAASTHETTHTAPPQLKN